MSNLPIRTHYQGDTVFIDFTLLEPDGAKLNLASVDEIEWSLSDPEDIDTPVLSKTLTGETVAAIDPSNGRCRVTIAAGDLDTPGQFVQEIEVTTGGVTYTYGQGPFIVKAAVKPA